MTPPFVDPAHIRRQAEGGGYERGLAYFRGGRRADVTWNAGRLARRVGAWTAAARRAYRCRIRLDPSRAERPIVVDLVHVPDAVRLQAHGRHAAREQRPRPQRRRGTEPQPASWRTLLAPPACATRRARRRRSRWASNCVSACVAAPRRGRRCAWRARRARGLHQFGAEVLVGLRPLERSARTDAWIKGAVSWDVLRRPGHAYEPAQARWFTELHSIARDMRLFGSFSDAAEWLTLDDVESHLLWPHLAAGGGPRHRRWCRRRSTRPSHIARDADVARPRRAHARRARTHAAADDRRRGRRHRRRCARSATSASTGSRCDASASSSPSRRCRSRTRCTRCSPRATPVTVPGGRCGGVHARAHAADRPPRRASRPRASTSRRPSARAVVTVRFAPSHRLDFALAWRYAGRSGAVSTRRCRDRDAGRRGGDPRAASRRSGRMLRRSPFAAAGSLSGIDAAEFAAAAAARARGRRRRRDRDPRRAPALPRAHRRPARDGVHGREHRSGLVRPRRHRHDRRPHDPVRAAVHGAVARARKKLLLSDGRVLLAHASVAAAAARPHRGGGRARRVGDRPAPQPLPDGSLGGLRGPRRRGRARGELARDGGRAARRRPDPAAPLPRGLHARAAPVPARPASSGSPSSGSTGSAASSPTTWASARRCRCSRSSRTRGRPARRGRSSSWRRRRSCRTWRSEAARFTPGPAGRGRRRHAREARDAVTDAAASADLVITSYTLLRLDEAEFARGGVGGAGPRRGAVRQEQPDEGVPRRPRPAAPT